MFSSTTTSFTLIVRNGNMHDFVRAIFSCTRTVYVKYAMLKGSITACGGPKPLERAGMRMWILERLRDCRTPQWNFFLEKNIPVR